MLDVGQTEGPGTSRDLEAEGDPPARIANVRTGTDGRAANPRSPPLPSPLPRRDPRLRQQTVHHARPVASGSVWQRLLHGNARRGDTDHDAMPAVLGDIAGREESG